MYADYSFYESSYGGSLLSATEFPALERRAALHIDLITYNRLHLGAPVTDAVRMATCAVADALKQQEDTEQQARAATGVKSENNDGYSVTYQDPAVAQAAFAAALTAAARPHLIYTGLMDRSAQ